MICPDDSTIIESIIVPDSSSENLIKNTIAVPSENFDDSADELIIQGKSKRSIKPFKRRERIRIVPGGDEYVVQRKRRSIVIPKIDYKTVNELQQIEKCCANQVCKCDEDKCIRNRPICQTGQILLLIRTANKKPGDCCSEYRCNDRKPNCVSSKFNVGGNPAIALKINNSNLTEIEWIDGLKQCKCIDGEAICNNGTNEHTVASASHTDQIAFDIESISCYSSSHNRHFPRNATWSEDDCTHCMCDDSGVPICHSSVCKPKNCAKLIRVPGECCPVCDQRDSKYCAGHSDCGIVCRYGLDIHPINGCQICKCAKSWPTPQTSAQPSSYPEIDATMDTNIIHNENTDFNLILHLPVLVVICLTIIIFMFIVGLTCKCLHYNKDKYCVNKKMYDNNLTPLI